MTRPLALALVGLTACAPPRDIIVQDEDLRQSVIAGVEWLEGEVGCQLFGSTDGQGNARDWKGPFPTLGNIRAETGYSGHMYAYTDWKPRRATMKFQDGLPHLAAVVHELGHALGLEHVERDGVVMSSKAALHMDLEMQDAFRRLCMDH